jgi:hypothetical protein
MLQRIYLAGLAGAMLLASAACTKDAPPAAASTIAPSEHVAPSPVGTTQTVLEKTFNLKTTATFPFEIPAHAAEPHLHGIFESFVGQVHRASDDTANIDFLILNEEQQQDFSSGRESETMFSVEGSHNQAVNFDLPASLGHAAKYYLVFRNPAEGKASRVVEANFHVDY